MKRLPILLICCLGFLMFNCKHNESETVEVEEITDPFFFNTNNYYDFLKQGRAMIENDSTFYGGAMVEEWMSDSIIINDEAKERIKFVFLHSLTNLGDNNWYHDFHMKYIKRDSILVNTKSNNLNHRFLPLLEALKQIKYKTMNNPKFSTLMEFQDNKDLGLGAVYNKLKEEWEYYIIIINLENDTTKYNITLTKDQFDSLIYKMDNIRTIFLKY